MSDAKLVGQIKGLLEEFKIPSTTEANTFFSEIASGEALSKAEMVSMKKLLKGAEVDTAMGLLVDAAIEKVPDSEGRLALRNKYEVVAPAGAFSEALEGLEVEAEAAAEKAADRIGRIADAVETPAAKVTAAQKLVNLQTAAEMLKETGAESFATKAGMGEAAVGDYKKAVQQEIDSLLKLGGIETEGLAALKADSGSMEALFTEDLAAQVDALSNTSVIHEFPEGEAGNIVSKTFAVNDATKSAVQTKNGNADWIKEITESVEPLEVPNPHANKFKSDVKFEISADELKKFGEGENKAKAALQEMYKPAQIEALQEHIGEIAAAKDDNVKAAVEKFEKHIETLAKDGGVLDGVKPQARQDIINRAVKDVRGALEHGDDKPLKELSEKAATALEGKNLQKTVAENTKGAGNYFTRAYERSGTMISEGMTGGAEASKFGRIRVAGGSAVALGGIVLGAKNIVRGVTGYENPETGEQEAGSFGKVAFGAAEALGGTALGVLAATGRWR